MPDGDAKWAHQHLGAAQQQQGDLVGSIVSFQRAVRLGQKDETSWLELAVSYDLQGKYASALKVLTRVLALRPAHTFALTMKGRLHLHLHEEAEAIASCPRPPGAVKRP